MKFCQIQVFVVNFPFVMQVFNSIAVALCIVVMHFVPLFYHYYCYVSSFSVSIADVGNNVARVLHRDREMSDNITGPGGW